MYEEAIEEKGYDTDDAERDDAKDYKQRLEAANEHIDAITKENRKLRARVIELDIGPKPF
jgi:predicted RNase H-like nuclease (RuvC/YqgF family)